MSRILIISVCILQIAISVQCSGLYSVIGPGILRPRSDYHVTISVYDAPSDCTFKIGLTGPDYDDEQTIEVPAKSSKVIKFEVPKLKEGDYSLTAEGLSGIIFQNSTKLNYTVSQPFVYIQTDKATYKPGDKVQYRVLVLDANTRPAKIDGPLKIVVYDAARNLIKQLKDVKLTKGVYSGEFQLSEYPVLGFWCIEASVDGATKTTTIDVDKYVLPKFAVQLQVPKNVELDDGKFRVFVRSQYTNGKPVKGKAIVTAKIWYAVRPPRIVEKSIQIDGKGYVAFDMSVELKLDNKNDIPPLTILAIVEEELTGLKQNATTSVNVHLQKYYPQIRNTPDGYHPGKLITINVNVENIDGSPVLDPINPVSLFLKPKNNYFRGFPRIETTVPPPTKMIKLTKNFDMDGIARFKVLMPGDEFDSYLLTSTYLGSSTDGRVLWKHLEYPMTRIPKTLKITIQTKNPSLGNEVSIIVSDGKPIPFFVYTIIGRGDIIQSDIIQVPNNRNYHVFKITPTFEMVPRAIIFIHYVIGNDLEYAEEQIYFENDFKNSISIKLPAQAKPGEEIQLEVSTDPDSYVGLLGVDQSVLLLKTGNDLKKDDIFSDLSRHNTRLPYSIGFGKYPGRMSGVITMTNANFWYEQVLFFPMRGIIKTAGPVEYSVDTTGSSKSIAPVIRKLFPETWMFDNIKTTTGSGVTLRKTVPDTITSWVITGFSLNPETGLALTKESSKLRVFQPFFVSTNLPYSVKRGEVISIPVVVFNYLDNDLITEVTLDNSEQEFEFINPTDEVTENVTEGLKLTKFLSIPTNSGKSTFFMIRPKKVGQVMLKITAISPLAGDAIHQSLTVEPEGVTTYVNKAFFFNLNESNEKLEKVDIDIPDDVVPDSEYIELSFVGDLLGPTIQNLDNLVRMPYGCGEQNMVNFVPNILVLKYLTTINKLTPEIEEKAKKFLAIGYQRELQYKHDDGSFSSFGKKQGNGSIWLTAYVVKSFHQALLFTDIDPKIIVHGLQFLASKQLPSGEFPLLGRVIDSSYGVHTIGLTSFVLLAFLENVELANLYKDNIEKGLDYLENALATTDDQYSLAIAGWTLLLGKRFKSAEQILTKLEGLSKKDGDHQWWSKKIVSTNQWYQLRSSDVEMTSYIALALLENGTAESVLPIIKWLLTQRNSKGGFSSTQNTVIGLQALIKFAEKSGSGTTDMEFEFTDGKDNSGKITVTPDTSVNLQTHMLPTTVRQVEITAKGKGSSLVQVSYRYNLINKDIEPRFTMTLSVEDLLKDQLALDICTEFIPLDGEFESSMTVMEVSLPSGYTADINSFDHVKSIYRIKRVETKNSASVVIFYFDGLDHCCVPVDAIKSHAVAKLKPAPVVVYDYYDNNKRATAYYEIKSSLCDICENDDCGPGCAKNN